MKIKSIIVSILILSIFCGYAQASQLPKEVRDYLVTRKKVPTIRFDSVVVYNNDVMYLPIYPSYPKETEELKIVKTYPENQTMDNLPDMVLFNNNFGLLKLIRTGADTISVRNIPNLPSEIKTGLIPQDIMVPRGLVLPESLAGIIGDVQIPLIGSAKTTAFVSGRKSAPLPSGKKVNNTRQYNVPSQLKNKLFFVNNFQTEYLQIYSPTVTEPLYSLKTSGVMKDVKPVNNGKYLLIATKDKKNIDVVDVNEEYIVKQIDLTSEVSEITVDDINKKAYAASLADESLYIIDTETFSIKEKIQLAGSPHRLSLSPDGTKLAYTDLKTSNIYILDLQNEYENKLITNYPNITKMILKDKNIYLIARTKPQLRVVYYDLLQDIKTVKSRKDRKRESELIKEQNADASSISEDIVTQYDEPYDEDGIKNMKMYATSIKDIPIGPKPVDMAEKNNNIYILCAGNNSVYTYSEVNEELKTEKLPMEGFAKSLTPVPDSNLAVITNMSDYKYAVYDMEKSKSMQVQPISENINMITILERTNGH